MHIDNHELRLTNRDVSAIVARLKKETGLSHAKTIDAIAGALGFSGGNALMSLLKAPKAAADADRSTSSITNRADETIADLKKTYDKVAFIGPARFHPDRNAPADFYAQMPNSAEDEERTSAPWLADATISWAQPGKDDVADDGTSAEAEPADLFLDELVRDSLWPRPDLNDFISYLRSVDQPVLADYLSEHPDAITAMPEGLKHVPTPKHWHAAIQRLQVLDLDRPIQAVMDIVAIQIGKTHRDALVERLKAS